MPLLATAEEIILAEMNLENSLALKAPDMLFGQPGIPTTAEELAAANGHNSMVRVQALATAPAIGYTTVYYDRVDFADIFTDLDGNQPLVIPARLDSVFVSHDIVPLINQYYGLSLKTADVLSVDINRVEWTVQLIAADTSLGWIGSQVVQLLPGDALLPSNFDPTTVEPYSYPYFNTKVGQGAVYSYPWRFDDYAAELKAGGTTITVTRLAAILKAVTGDAWLVYRSPIDYNLKEAIVSYNGVNKSSLPTNPTVDNVLIIDLSLYCLNLGGKLYLHYNDPD